MGKPTICGTCGWNNWKQHDSSTPAATQEPAGSDPRVQCMTCGAIFVEHARPCPKCGGKSIHHTVYNDHERTPATQEQPAGSGASELKKGDEVLVRGKVKLLFADGVVAVSFERPDPMNNQVAYVESSTVSGSPRKVGEEGASELKVGDSVRVSGIVESISTDGTLIKVDFGMGEYCYPNRLLLHPRPSSVPVGEQKQEEGV